MNIISSHGHIADAPGHIAIIMDGNGRWAKKRGLPRFMGHRAGVDAVWRTLDAALDLGVRHITLFGFSSENWKRPPLEVSGLMHLLRTSLRNELFLLHRKGIKIRCIGDRTRLDPDIVEMIEDGEKLEPDEIAMHLTVAWNYGGRDELTCAARRIAERVAAGDLRPDQVDAAALAGELDTKGLPDPDLIIRTSGEMRLSNFMLWQAAYAELIFIDTLWPDFGRKELETAIREFWRRDRRFGAAPAKAAI